MAADRFLEICNESSLCIGVSSLLVLPVARLINNISRELKNAVNLEVRSGLSFTLIRDLINSKIDVAIVPTFDFGDQPLSHVRIASGVTLSCYASSLNPIFKKESIEWGDLAKYPLVVGTGDSPIKQIIAKKLIAEGVKIPPQFELSGDNFEFFKTVVKNGNSISFALFEDIQGDVERGILRVLPLPSELSLDIDAITHQSHFATHLVQLFISNAKAVWHNAG